MKTIYFVRHGQSEGNAADKVAGAETDSPLTDLGRQQAVEAAGALLDKSIDLIVCSPLSRAKESAQIIAKEIGYKGQILEKSNFSERYVGSLVGKTFEEYKEAVRSDNLPEGVESISQMVSRVQDGLAWLKDQKANNILLVSHGGIGKIVRAVSQGIGNLDYKAVDKIKELDNSEAYKFNL